MPDQLLIRDVPGEIVEWIRDSRDRERKTQNEFVLDLLRDAWSQSKQLGLFVAPPRVEVVPGSLPFTFVDLFAGIGGLRIGLERAGGRCVFSCEWDRWAQKTYRAWFGETPHGDIRHIHADAIPRHDVLAAGFPCQPFSIAGVSKKKSLGKAHGFADREQGNLFFELARIIAAKRPAVLLLENVKNLKSHDLGRTWGVIEGELKSLRYRIFPEVIDAAGWVPQHRERFFMIGFDKDVFGDQVDFVFPRPDGETPRLTDILEQRVEKKYTLTDHLWEYLQRYAEKHRKRGNGFGFGLVDTASISRTLSARYYKDGSEILIPQRGKNPRRLTPRECARLMGFPDDLQIVVSDTQAYKQFGNSVCVPVVEAIARNICTTIGEHLATNGLLRAREAG